MVSREKRSESRIKLNKSYHMGNKQAEWAVFVLTRTRISPGLSHLACPQAHPNQRIADQTYHIQRCHHTISMHHNLHSHQHTVHIHHTLTILTHVIHIATVCRVEEAQFRGHRLTDRAMVTLTAQLLWALHQRAGGKDHLELCHLMHLVHLQDSHEPLHQTRSTAVLQ